MGALVAARVEFPPLRSAGPLARKEKPHGLDDKHAHYGKEYDAAKHGMKEKMVENGAEVGCATHLGQQEHPPKGAT